MEAMDVLPLHIAIYPWFAMGHLTPLLRLSNKIANRGHKISFFIPKNTINKLQHLNHHPHLISFIPITVPHVDGLPHDAETTADVPFSLFPLIATALDSTEKDIELLLEDLKPQIVLFDFQHWLPNLTRKLGIKSVQYFITSIVAAAYISTNVDLLQLPPEFPDSFLNFYSHELRFIEAVRKLEFGGGLSLFDRFAIGTRLSDAVGFRGCRDTDDEIYADYLEKIYEKPVLLSGPLLPDPPTTTLDEKWVSWLGGFKASSVVFCAYGSENILNKNQFQELLLGLELTGFPFLAALKPPSGFETVEEALPEGFSERVKERGIVYGGWVQQQLILGHSSVGCFITHCGAASITEGLVNKCQLVLLPRLGTDHIFNARVMSRKLKVGVEVEKGEEDGLFTKESVCKAVKIVMDDENELGREVRANHTKMRDFLLSENLESSCIDSFCQKLHDLL